MLAGESPIAIGIEQPPQVSTQDEPSCAVVLAAIAPLTG